MLKLHGFAVSNYFNMVRMALMEKGAPFEIVETYPSQESAYLARSPVGKVPCLETGHGFLSETSVMLDYIEDVVPTPAFYPADPFKRAQVRQVGLPELSVPGGDLGEAEHAPRVRRPLDVLGQSPDARHR